MDSVREQHLLDEIAKRDAIIERLSAENLVLRQTVDAISRRVFGVSSEKLDAAQLELLLDADAAKKAPAADPADQGPAAEIRDHRKRLQKTRAPRFPDHLPVQREEVIPAEVELEPAAFRRIGEEVREQLGFKPAEFFRVQLVRPKYVRIDNPVAKPVIATLPPSLQERCIATPGLIAEVTAGRLDAAVVAENMSIPQLIRWSPFLREPLWVIAPKHLASDDPVAMLKNLPFVRFQNPVPLSALINTELARLQVATQDIAEVDSIASIINCVAEGMGISIVPDIALRGPEAEALVYRPFGQPQVYRQVGLIERINSSRATVIDHFHSVLAETCGEYGVERDADRTRNL